MRVLLTVAVGLVVVLAACGGTGSNVSELEAMNQAGAFQVGYIAGYLKGYDDMLRAAVDDVEPPELTRRSNEVADEVVEFARQQEDELFEDYPALEDIPGEPYAEKFQEELKQGALLGYVGGKAAATEDIENGTVPDAEGIREKAAEESEQFADAYRQTLIGQD